jgi:hypothetical protein
MLVVSRTCMVKTWPHSMCRVSSALPTVQLATARRFRVHRHSGIEAIGSRELSAKFGIPSHFPLLQMHRMCSTASSSSASRSEDEASSVKKSSSSAAACRWFKQSAELRIEIFEASSPPLHKAFSHQQIRNHSTLASALANTQIHRCTGELIPPSSISKPVPIPDEITRAS